MQRAAPSGHDECFEGRRRVWVSRFGWSTPPGVGHRFGGGPVGLSTLAISVGEETDTVEDVYEPYLLQLGLLKRTPRGRVATLAAFAHLGLPPPERLPALFD